MEVFFREVTYETFHDSYCIHQCLTGFVLVEDIFFMGCVLMGAYSHLSCQCFSLIKILGTGLLLLLLVSISVVVLVPVNSVTAQSIDGNNDSELPFQNETQSSSLLNDLAGQPNANGSNTLEELQVLQVRPSDQKDVSTSFLKLGPDFDEVLQTFSIENWIPEGDVEIDVNAKQLRVDPNSEVITAVGDTQVRIGKLIIKANRLVIDKTQGLFTAEGLVELSNTEDPDTVLRAERIAIDQKVATVMAEKLHLMIKHRQITAKKLIFQQDNTLIFENASYTSCPIVTNPQEQIQQPFWKFDFRYLIVDELDKTIILNDFAFSLKGLKIPLPLLLLLPDFRLVRDTGLTNVYLSSSLSIPDSLRFGPEFFVVMSPTQDITFIPWFDQTPSGSMQIFPEIAYRQQFVGGDLDARFGVVSRTQFIKGTQFNYDISGSYDVSPAVKAGWGFRNGSTLLANKVLNNPTRRTNHFYLEQFATLPNVNTDKDYYGRYEIFSSRKRDDFVASGRDHLIAPNIVFENALPTQHSNMSAINRTNVRFSNSEEYTKTWRVSNNFMTQWKSTGAYGMVWGGSAGIFSQLGYVDTSTTSSVATPIQEQLLLSQQEDYTFSRTLNMTLSPYAASYVSLPMVAFLQRDTHIIEPRVGLVVTPLIRSAWSVDQGFSPHTETSTLSPKKLLGWHLPNEDNAISTINYRQLFSPSGHEVFDSYAGSVRAVFGTSYDAHLKNETRLNVNFATSIPLFTLEAETLHGISSLQHQSLPNDSVSDLYDSNIVHFGAKISLPADIDLSLNVQNHHKPPWFSNNENNKSGGTDISFQADITPAPNTLFSAYYVDSPINNSSYLARKLSDITPEQANQSTIDIADFAKNPTYLQRIGTRIKFQPLKNVTVSGNVEFGIGDTPLIYRAQALIGYQDLCLRLEIGAQHTLLSNYLANSWSIIYGLSLML